MKVLYYLGSTLFPITVGDVLMDMPLTRHTLIDLVKSAATPIATAFGLPLTYQGKDGSDAVAAAVTDIDHAVQRTLMGVFAGDFIGEEVGGRFTQNHTSWFVDPLDGTGARIRGLASATCIVTLMQTHNGIGRPVMTVLHNPITHQTWSAQANAGAFYQYADSAEHRCVLNSQSSLPKKILATITLWPGTDFRFDEVKQAIQKNPQFDTQDFGALGSAHATVATGTTHLSACRASAAYETAAAALLMQEAGGVAYDLHGANLIQDGFPLRSSAGKYTFMIPHGAVIAANEAVAHEFLEIVRWINS